MYKYVRIYEHVYLYICMHVYVCRYTYSHIDTHLYIYIYGYIWIHIQIVLDIRANISYRALNGETICYGNRASWDIATVCKKSIHAYLHTWWGSVSRNEFYMGSIRRWERDVDMCFALFYICKCTFLMLGPTACMCGCISTAYAQPIWMHFYCTIWMCIKSALNRYC